MLESQTSAGREWVHSRNECSHVRPCSSPGDRMPKEARRVPKRAWGLRPACVQGFILANVDTLGYSRHPRLYEAKRRGDRESSRAAEREHRP
jgi:hypothetical protein